MLVASVSQQFTNAELRESLPMTEMAGTLLCLLAYLIKLYGSYTFQPLEYRATSFPLFISGILLIVFNFQTLKTLLFSITFLAFLIPPPIELAQSAGSILSTISSKAAYNLLKTMGLPVSLSETYLTPVIHLKTSQGSRSLSP